MIDAALTIVHESGISAVGVRSLCARTNLNQRYFYESFGAVEDVLLAALDAIIDELLSAGAVALHDRTYRARVARARHVMSTALAVILDDPRKASLLGAVSAGPAPLPREFRRRIGRLTEAILSDQETVAHGFDRSTAIYVTAGSTQLTTAWLAGELDIDRDELADRLARLAVGAAGHRTR